MNRVWTPAQTPDPSPAPRPVRPAITERAALELLVLIHNADTFGQQQIDELIAAIELLGGNIGDDGVASC